MGISSPPRRFHLWWGLTESRKMGKSNRLFVVSILAVFLCAMWAAPARAATSATAIVTSQQLAPNSYEYSVTLNNTGTTPISTLWLGWVPFYDLLPSAPTKITSPAGWTGINAPDLFGVASAQWVNTTTPLQPGNSLSGFKFDTPDTPAAIGGTSFFAGFPVLETYVYAGAPQTDAGFAFAPTLAAPEPGSLALIFAAAPLLLRRKARR